MRSWLVEATVWTLQEWLIAHRSRYISLLSNDQQTHLLKSEIQCNLKERPWLHLQGHRSAWLLLKFLLLLLLLLQSTCPLFVLFKSISIVTVIQTIIIFENPAQAYLKNLLPLCERCLSPGYLSQQLAGFLLAFQLLLWLVFNFQRLYSHGTFLPVSRYDVACFLY